MSWSLKLRLAVIGLFVSLSGLTGLGAGRAEAQATNFLVCSHSGSETALNSSVTTNMRAKLTNPNYFGPGGTVAPETLSFSTLTTINASTLAACDIFFGGGSGDISSTEANAVRTWALSDPDHFVIAGCDNTSQQSCSIFGRPNVNGSSGGGVDLNSALSYNPADLWRCGRRWHLWRRGDGLYGAAHRCGARNLPQRRICRSPGGFRR